MAEQASVENSLSKRGIPQRLTESPIKKQRTGEKTGQDSAQEETAKQMKVGNTPCTLLKALCTQQVLHTQGGVVYAYLWGRLNTEHIVQQVVKDRLQAASVPEAGLQDFEEHWNLSGSKRASGANKGSIDWTFYSPDTGKKVQSVCGLVKIFTSRWLGEDTFCPSVIP